MRIAASSRLVLAIAAALVATVSGTAVRAQSAATNLLGVYEQSALNTCPNTGACRVDFSTVQQNLKVLRVSCLIDIQSNAINPLISDFELGNASADQTGYAFRAIPGAGATSQFDLHGSVLCRECRYATRGSCRHETIRFDREQSGPQCADHCSVLDHRVVSRLNLPETAASTMRLPRSQAGIDGLACE
jgi:hypothetical protein